MTSRAEYARKYRERCKKEITFYRDENNDKWRRKHKCLPKRAKQPTKPPLSQKESPLAERGSSKMPKEPSPVKQPSTKQPTKPSPAKPSPPAKQPNKPSPPAKTLIKHTLMDVDDGLTISEANELRKKGHK